MNSWSNMEQSSSYKKATDKIHCTFSNSTLALFNLKLKIKIWAKFFTLVVMDPCSHYSMNVIIFCHSKLFLKFSNHIFFYVIASPKLLLKHNVVYTSTLSFTQKFTRIIVGFHPFKVWEEVEDNALHLGFVIRNYCVKKVRGLFW